MTSYYRSWVGSLTFSSLLLTSFLITGPRTSARVLDNFDDNQKKDWSDFTFIDDFGLPSEANGQFRFELPPVGDAIFTASQKTSEIFELKEGRTVEFRVDVIEAGGKDSFAVLAFLPVANSPGTLAGYGLSKSTTDILISKGINKYFVADDGAEANLKNENITLVLSLTVREGNVVIHAQALDKDAENAVLWEKTVIDTPTADVLAAGTDDPAAPYITKGYFSLYCYADFDARAPEDPYKVYYDNAETFVTDSVVLDDFNDNTKTDWSDFTFIDGFGIPSEANGQFRFELPPVGDAIFTASQKTSRVFELTEGERVEFSVDVVEGGGKDSFAVLAFIPTANSPGTLAGYGFAKSTTDILITKGVNKYFVADDGADANLKNENITLVLSLTVRGGNVVIHAKALDKAAENAVLWEKTVIDTPNADVLAAGTDDPAAPYITKGYFSLYCYADFDARAPEDPYKVYFDNAIVSAPPVAANVAPIISNVGPIESGNFLPVSTEISFRATDDKGLDADKFSISLNGTTYTVVNGLVVSAVGTTRTATLSGKLAPDVNYSAVLTVVDSEGESASKTIYFDTFLPGNLVIEAEDYNFDAGSFVQAPVVIPEGTGPNPDSYSLQAGVIDVDFHDTRTSPNAPDTKYRPQDPVRMGHSLDYVRSKYSDAGGSGSLVFDFSVGDIAEGEWMNYTRDFPAGAYEVYLRESLANTASAESILELVTSNPSEPGQTVRSLGSFLGVLSGFQSRNYPLTDGGGTSKLRVNLAGVTTLRLRQVTPDPADGARALNYLVFVRTGDIVVQPAVITAISPAPDSTIAAVSPIIRIEIQNRDTSVDTLSIQLIVNGKTVIPAITSDANGAVVTHPLDPLPASGAKNEATISFKDNQNRQISTTWGFVVNYKSVNPDYRVAGTGITAGFKLRVVQAPAGSNLANSLQRAEDQLKANSPYPKEVDITDTAQTINFNKREGQSRGQFLEDVTVPGIDPAVTSNGLDDFTVEALAYLELSKGVYRFRIITDDGYKLTAGRTFSDLATTPLGFHTDGTADETVDFVVPAAGLYPFRFLWYERGGEGYSELSSVDIGTGASALVNDPNDPNAIKAFMEVTSPSLLLQSSASVSGPFGDEPAAVVDVNAKQISVAIQGSTRFYRLISGSALTVKSIKIQAGTAVLIYE